MFRSQLRCSSFSFKVPKAKAKRYLGTYPMDLNKLRGPKTDYEYSLESCTHLYRHLGHCTGTYASPMMTQSACRKSSAPSLQSPMQSAGRTSPLKRQPLVPCSPLRLGPQNDPKLLHLPGLARLRIGARISSALHHFRRRDRPSQVWANAVYINQHSVAERNRQVQRHAHKRPALAYRRASTDPIRAVDAAR